MVSDPSTKLLRGYDLWSLVPNSVGNESRDSGNVTSLELFFIICDQ